MFNLFTKTLYDKRAFIIGWSLGLMAVGCLMMLFYPAFHQDNGIDELVKSLPTAFQGLVGDLGNLKQLSTYIGSQLFDVRIPILVSILSIILAVGLTVGEEEKGQLRTLVGLPLSRAHILFSKWLAIVTICLFTTIATVIGIEIGLVVINETLDWMVILRLAVMMWLLSVALATVIFGIGLATGKRGLTMGLAVATTIGSFILTTFARSVEWLQPYEHASIFHYFPAATIAKSEIDLVDVLVYIVIIIVFLTVGIIGFRRRDVR
ncbi:MAG TPA: ABC transporter permease subunit [Candidatus Saccharimonadales bacterium]